MHKPESVLKNGTHKHLWDFEKETDHTIPARSDLVMIKKNKRIFYLVDFVLSADDKVKNESKWNNRYIPGSCQRAEKVMEYEVGTLGTNSRSQEKRLAEHKVR